MSEAHVLVVVAGRVGRDEARAAEVAGRLEVGLGMGLGSGRGVEMAQWQAVVEWMAHVAGLVAAVPCVVAAVVVARGGRCAYRVLVRVEPDLVLVWVCCWRRDWVQGGRVWGSLAGTAAVMGETVVLAGDEMIARGTAMVAESVAEQGVTVAAKRVGWRGCRAAARRSGPRRRGSGR